MNAAAIGMHLAGSVGQLADDRARLTAQQGVATMAALKTGLTAAAVGVTAYSRAAGKKVSQHTAVPVQDATTPTAAKPDDVAAAQRQLAALQWASPP